MAAYRTGNVFFKETRAGTISETEDGYRFAYCPDYLNRKDAQAVSVTLPLQEEPFDSPVLHPFFDGLIPEGWLLSVVVRNWKINERDRMGLLLTVCNDCIGAVCVTDGEN